MSGTRVPNWRAVVKAVAAGRERKITDADADYILWEHTGFPSFYNGNAVVVFAGQADAFLVANPDFGKPLNRARVRIGELTTPTEDVKTNVV